MKTITPASWDLLAACPFPEFEDGVFGNGHAMVRPWKTPECSGDVEVYPTHTDTPKAALHFDDTPLRTVLRAAAAAWPETANAVPGGVLDSAGPMPDMLSTLLPPSETLPRERLSGYDRPHLRMWFRPDDASFTDLWLTLPTHVRNFDARISGGMCGRDLEAVKRFMLALHH